MTVNTSQQVRLNCLTLHLPVLPLPDSVKDVAHLPEDHLQAAEGRRDAEPGRRAGDGVSTEPGLHGNENQQTHNLQRNYQHLSASFQDI